MSGKSCHACIVKDSEHLPVSCSVNDSIIHRLHICDSDNLCDLCFETFQSEKICKECLSDANFCCVVLERYCSELVCLLSWRNCLFSNPLEIGFKRSDRIINAALDICLANLCVKIAVSLANCVDNFSHDGEWNRCACFCCADCFTVSCDRSSVLNILHERASVLHRFEVILASLFLFLLL